MSQKIDIYLYLPSFGAEQFVFKKSFGYNFKCNIQGVTKNFQDF